MSLCLTALRDCLQLRKRKPGMNSNYWGGNSQAACVFLVFAFAPIADIRFATVLISLLAMKVEIRVICPHILQTLGPNIHSIIVR